MSQASTDTPSTGQSTTDQAAEQGRAVASTAADQARGVADTASPQRSSASDTALGQARTRGRLGARCGRTRRDRQAGSRQWGALPVRRS